MKKILKSYSNDKITVSFEAKTCIHSANCLRGLPEVFDLKKRPWINVNGSSKDRIMSAIDNCPSGALSYVSREVHDPGKNISEQAVIKLQKDGPYNISGNVKIELEDGTIIEKSGKFSLCRCGGSSTKPFCDGTHKKSGTD